MRNRKLVICIWALSIFFGLMKYAYAEPMSMATAMIISSLIGAGAGIGGGLLAAKGRGGDQQEMQTFMPKTEFLKMPAPEFYPGPKPEQYAEFPEAEAARQTWWGKLQEWGAEPGYGAIAPDWGDIWEESQRKVKQYYWGGPGGEPGIAGKVRASAARRGVSESPALEAEMGKMGRAEAADIRSMATQQALERAKFAEAGRQNWLQQMQAMTSLRPMYYQPAGMWQGPYAATEQSYFGGGGGGGGAQTGQLVGDLGAAGMNLAAQYQQQNWLQNMLAMQGAQTGLEAQYGPGQFTTGQQLTSQYPELAPYGSI